VTHRRPKTKMRMDAKGTSERLEAVRIRLLGGFEVSVGARTIKEGDWRLRKAASLIKLLALASGNPLHREQLTYTLWPNLGISAASNNLRQTVHAARRILDAAMGSSYLASREESLVLCPQSSLWWTWRLSKKPLGLLGARVTWRSTGRLSVAFVGAKLAEAKSVCFAEGHDPKAFEHERDVWVASIMHLVNLTPIAPTPGKLTL
jgi:hypothetical protein